jgi:DUF4097 and DUF4098 domain-containing protein YvlB
MRLTALPLSICGLLMLTGNAHAQNWQTSPCIHDTDHESRHDSCERRTATVGAGSAFKVISGSGNGGIDVRGEDRRDIRIEAEVVAHASSWDDAQKIIHSVEIKADSSSVTDSGPHWMFNKGYSVNYVLRVPKHLALDLHTSNGGISLAHLDAHIRFETTNGGVDLSDLAGDVKGSTTNGGLDIALSGDRWQGTGLRAETTNGGVDISVPAHYSAHLETETVNGGIDLDFPVTVQGKIGKELNVNLGSGGAVVHATTVNGGVSLKRS